MRCPAPSMIQKEKRTQSFTFPHSIVPCDSLSRMQYRIAKTSNTFLLLLCRTCTYFRGHGGGEAGQMSVLCIQDDQTSETRDTSGGGQRQNCSGCKITLLLHVKGRRDGAVFVGALHRRRKRQIKWTRGLRRCNVSESECPRLTGSGPEPLMSIIVFLLLIYFILFLYVRARPMISIRTGTRCLPCSLAHNAPTDAVRVAETCNVNLRPPFFSRHPAHVVRGGRGRGGCGGCGHTTVASVRHQWPWGGGGRGGAATSGGECGCSSAL